MAVIIKAVKRDIITAPTITHKIPKNRPMKVFGVLSPSPYLRSKKNAIKENDIEVTDHKEIAERFNT